jgi:signal transduction histidine kinase
VSGAQVLIVDDDPALLEALPETLRLRLNDLEVDTTDSAQAALARIAARDYDALIVDIKMPGLDGLALLAEIKQRRPDTPTLLITGHGDHELATQALRAGAYDYITKPIDRDYFTTSLSRAIECHRLGRELAQKRRELAQHASALEACVQERTVELRDALHREATARAELERARAELEALSRQREAFVAQIAHELAGPMTTIRGYAELLGRPATDPVLRERARLAILSQTGRVARLAEDLAQAAHLTAGQFQIRPAWCDLVELAEEQIELARDRAAQHDFQLQAPLALQVLADRDRLGQVLANLLGNAVKYATCGRIGVRIWSEGNQARLSVSDEGPGIPAEQAELVFEPGQRLPSAEPGGAPHGAGLDLYIARGIVEAHGGKIWVETAPGQGATFNLALPRASVAVEPTAN